MRITRPGPGGAIQKVQCQACGGHKLLGRICDAPVEGGVCSWPQVRVEQLEKSGALLVFMPLCPSTNARESVIRAGRFAQKVLTPEARDYIASVSAELQPLISAAIREWGWKPFTYWRVAEVWLTLPRTTCDPHNYFKVSLDTLEKAGAFFDDRYAIARIGGLTFNSQHPEMVFKL